MKPTVLLVDDDLAVLQGLMRNLRKEPYQCRTATSAEEALRILAGHPVDLIVCDWSMPDMSGTEFLTKVAKQYPDTIRIMLTGQATLPVAMGAINNGGVHKFLTKPCDAATLAVTIRQALLTPSAAGHQE